MVPKKPDPENAARLALIREYAAKHGISKLAPYIGPLPKKETPLAHINAFCKHCMGESWDTETGERYGDLEPPVKCETKYCVLWIYRTGRGPRGRRKPMAPTQKEAAAVRLQRARIIKKAV